MIVLGTCLNYLQNQLKVIVTRVNRYILVASYLKSTLQSQSDRQTSKGSNINKNSTSRVNFDRGIILHHFLSQIYIQKRGRRNLRGVTLR